MTKQIIIELLKVFMWTILLFCPIPLALILDKFVFSLFTNNELLQCILGGITVTILWFIIAFTIPYKFNFSSDSGGSGKSNNDGTDYFNENIGNF